MFDASCPWTDKTYNSCLKRKISQALPANTLTHWGRGDLETSGNILGKLWALDHFSPNVSTNRILGTFRLWSQHVPNMYLPNNIQNVARNGSKIFLWYAQPYPGMEFQCTQHILHCFPCTFNVPRTSSMFPKYTHWTYPRNIFDNICGSWFECYWWLHAGNMLRSQSGCTQNLIGGYIGGKMIQSPQFTQDVPTSFQVTLPPVIPADWVWPTSSNAYYATISSCNCLWPNPLPLGLFSSHVIVFADSFALTTHYCSDWLFIILTLPIVLTFMDILSF